MTIGRSRGHRGRRYDEAIMHRARKVANGELIDTNPIVLSLAADICLEKELKARQHSKKHNILSHRQLARRRRREIYVASGAPEYLPNPRNRRSVRQRKGTAVRREDLMYG